MNRPYTSKELEQLLQDANARAHKGRLNRLQVLVSEGDQDPAPIPSLAVAYFEEARLCWVDGAFVATIVMSQLAFEEALRAHYRMWHGVRGKIDSGKEVSDAGFAELVDQSKNDGWILPEEAEALHRLRKDYRNPYVHSKDIPGRPDFFTQTLKIFAPEILRTGVEEEARESITLLVSLLPRICRRLWGIE